MSAEIVPSPKPTTISIQDLMTLSQKKKIMTKTPVKQVIQHLKSKKRLMVSPNDVEDDVTSVSSNDSNDKNANNKLNPPVASSAPSSDNVECIQRTIESCLKLDISSKPMKKHRQEETQEKDKTKEKEKAREKDNVKEKDNAREKKDHDKVKEKDNDKKEKNAKKKHSPAVSARSTQLSAKQLKKAKKASMFYHGLFNTSGQEDDKKPKESTNVTVIQHANAEDQIPKDQGSKDQTTVGREKAIISMDERLKRADHVSDSGVTAANGKEKPTRKRKSPTRAKIGSSLTTFFHEPEVEGSKQSMTFSAADRPKGVRGYNRSRQKLHASNIDLQNIFETPEPRVVNEYWVLVPVPQKALFRKMLTLPPETEPPMVPFIPSRPEIDAQTLERAKTIDRQVELYQKQRNDLLSKISDLQ
jgi:hypothetical protein